MPVPRSRAWLLGSRRVGIRAHLIVSLTIDREDFDNVPVLLDAGGWRCADPAFEGRLGDVVKMINALVAA